MADSRRLPGSAQAARRGRERGRPQGLAKALRDEPPLKLPPADGPEPDWHDPMLTEVDASAERRAARRISDTMRGRRAAAGRASTGASGRSIAEEAAAAWAALPRLRMQPTLKRRHAAPLVNLFREDPAALAFDQLRTRLVQTLRARRWGRVAICAPTSGAGTTFTAVNLALSLSRIRGTRTILMDINQRAPGVAAMLGLSAETDLVQLLSGRLPVSRYLQRVSGTLALGLTSERAIGASELLQDPDLGPRLDQMRQIYRPDVMLFDLPPVLEHDDLLAFLPMVDGVLLISDGRESTARQLLEVERQLKGHTRLLGVVLNRARAESATL